MASEEYIKFGPWVYEIDNLKDLPKVFKPYYKEGEDYFLLIKIPRDVERRLVKDGMDLYDYVVAVYFDFIYILRRTEYGVEVIYIHFRDLLSVKNTRHLLRGTVEFYIAKGTINLTYNVVSQEIITKMMVLIRQRYAYDEYAAIATLPEIEFKGIVDSLLRTLSDKIFDQEHNIRVVAVQPTVPATAKPNNFVSDVWNALSSYKLQNFIIFSNTREFVIMNRGQEIRGAREAVHSAETYYIPFEQLTGFTTCKSEEYENLSILKLTCKETEHQFLYQTSNPFIRRFKDMLPDLISNYEWKRSYYE